MAKLSELKALEAHMLPIVSTYILGNISMFHKLLFLPQLIIRDPIRIRNRASRLGEGHPARNSVLDIFGFPLSPFRSLLHWE